MAYQYLDGLPSVAKKRYMEKLALVGIGEDHCPYKLPAGSWLQDPTDWPELTFGDLYQYLINSPGVFTKESMKNFKALEAHNYFVSGWVNTVFHIKTPTNDFVMKAEVKPSQRLNYPPHHPWVAVGKGGDVIAAHCTCMAGLGESCSHVAAVLFKVEAAVRLGYTSVACTSRPCEWNQCFTQNIDPAPIARISFHKEEAKARIKAKKQQRTTPQSTEQGRMELLKSLSQCKTKSVCLSTFREFSHLFKPRPVPVQKDTLPTPLRSLFKQEYISLEKDDLQSLCREVRSQLCVSLQEIQFLEESTRLQAQSITWFQQRAGRITASRAHSVMRASVEKPPVSLVKAICSDEVSSLSTEAMRWGRDHESDALKCYNEAMAAHHLNPVTSKSGLLVDLTFPFLGASPDSAVSCDCCQGSGVVEVKCPFSHRDKTMDVIKNKSDCPLDQSDRLKPSHPYYSQIQCQIYVAGAQYGDFVYWTPAECVVTRVTKDNDFIVKMCDKISMFWQSAVLPELLTRRLELGEPSVAVDCGPSL